MRLLSLLALLLVTPFTIAVAVAEEVYQAPDVFVREAFAGTPPEPSQLWITGALRDQASVILGHPPETLRTRYWRKDQRTAWILEEIGKEEPITVGLVVQDGQLETIKVLVYRESRGWEVRHDFFTRQFWQARLRNQNDLDRNIDGIAGATLSVNAMRKVARLALLYHRHVTTDGTP
ncbi:MAG: FMN-binding protein [Nevskiales bacterium]